MAAAPRVSEVELADCMRWSSVQENPSDTYSRANMEFHKAIRVGGVELMTSLTQEPIHPHASGPRGDDDAGRPAQRSIADHRDILAALEQRDAPRRERLAREHTMGLAAHVSAQQLPRPYGRTEASHRQYV